MPGVKIEDGKTVKFQTEEEQHDAANGVTAESEAQAMQDATDDVLASLLGSNDAENVESVQVLVGEVVLSFGIRTLSIREINAIQRKRLRPSGGKLVPLADAEVILRVQALVQCVRRNVGTPKAPRWEPQWMLEEVEGTPTKKGLIDNPSANAQELIAGLLEEVWARNKQIHPLVLSATQTIIEEQARLQLNG